MSSKVEKERAKQIQDKCQVLLTQMLKDEDNKYCVDCDAKGPRWASWNIGIFLCIRCAGIHRNLGVHISRVKSVNLDSWTPEQVVSLQQMGNSRARAVYEANLPDDFRRPQSDSALEQFIRAKYESKKYIAREWVPPTLPKVNWDKELDEEAEKLKRKKRDSKQPVNPVSNIRPLPSVIPQPLPKPVSTSPKPNRTKTNASPTADLLGLDAPFSNGTAASQQTKQEPDLFSNFMSAPSNNMVSNPAPSDSPSGTSNSASSKRTAEEDSFFNQPAANSPAKTKQQMSTDSILALYSKSQINASPFSAPPTGISGGMFGNMQPPAAPAANAFSSSDFMIPNGMANSNLLAQNDMFASMPNTAGVAPGVAHPTGSMNIVSNPFYNMTAGVPVNSQLFPISRENSVTSNGTSASSGMSQLPQQLGSMSLGGASSQAAPMVNPLLSSQPQSAPVINPVFNLQQQQSLNPLGQTLASNLWQ